jgi:cobalt/nickel transport system permease protein
MRLEPLDRPGERSGPLERLDARIKLIATLAFIVFTVLTPIGAWSRLGALGFVMALLVGLSGVPPIDLFRRWLTFLVLIAFLAVVLAPAHPDRATAGLGVVLFSILIKNSLAIVAMLLLSAVTSFHTLLAALRKLGLPRVLVATLGIMERYRFVLAEELNRMATARRARSFRGHGPFSFSLAGGLIGLLFLRAFERAERVHGAMVARGWQGTLRSLDE